MLRLAAGLFFATAAHAQLPGGYQLDSVRAALPDSLREVSHEGRFMITIVRDARTPLERKLLDVAEYLIPSKDSIIASTRGMTGSGHIKAFAAAAEMPGLRWWWREWDGVLLPYALTGHAVVQYTNHVRRLSAGPNPFASFAEGTQLRASLVYTARVRRVDLERLEVRLDVDLRVYCGPLCALAFKHSRVVLFDTAGNVLRVVGDGAPHYVVS